jgi:hypothetical protein
MPPPGVPPPGRCIALQPNPPTPQLKPLAGAVEPALAVKPQNVDLAAPMPDAAFKGLLAP